MNEKLEVSRSLLEVLADTNCPYGQLMAAKERIRALLAEPPIVAVLHRNGELIALKATVAQQAQMIEHLRGGPTPGYTAVDMTTAAAQGFRDGVASLLPVLEMARGYVHIEGSDEEADTLDSAIIAAGGRIKE